MTTIQLTLPDSIGLFVEEEAVRGGFEGPGHYIQSVLRELQTRREKGRLDQALLEGVDSPAAEFQPEEWEEIRREGLERIAAEAS